MADTLEDVLRTVTVYRIGLFESEGVRHTVVAPHVLVQPVPNDTPLSAPTVKEKRAT